MTSDDVDVSEALELHLKHYPGRNDAEFDNYFGIENAATARQLVRSILDEVMMLNPDWSQMTHHDVGDYVVTQMHARHPKLSPAALEAAGNYYTFLVR